MPGPDCHFEIANPSALISAVPQVRLVNLQPGGRVTLHAETMDRHGERWCSSATFDVPAGDKLDLSVDAPVSGSYAQADPEGLIWSLRPRDDLEIAFFAPSPDGFTVRLSAEEHREQHSEVVATASLERQLRHPKLQRLEVREHGLVGTLFTPEGGAHAGIVELGGSEGKLYETRAALLASQGFAVLALAYFDLPGLPDQLINVPLEYFKTALLWLRAHPAVSTARIGLIGTSKGGEAALLIAATYPELVAGVVGVVPSGVVFEGIDRSGANPNVKTRSSWSLEGKPVPFVPYTVDWNTYFSQPPPVSLTPAHVQAVDTCDPVTLEAATIRVERITTAVLLVSGGDDATWQSAPLSQVAQQRLEAHGGSVQHITDAAAGHSLSLPGLPCFVRTPWCTGGGTPAGNARVQREGWEAAIKLLRLDFP